jgi:hypothetical protein
VRTRSAAEGEPTTKRIQAQIHLGYRFALRARAFVGLGGCGSSRDTVGEAHNRGIRTGVVLLYVS